MSTGFWTLCTIASDRFVNFPSNSVDDAKPAPVPSSYARYLMSLRLDESRKKNRFPKSSLPKRSNESKKINGVRKSSLPKRSEKNARVCVPVDAHSEVDGDEDMSMSDIPFILKSGQSEHVYTKRESEAGTANLIHEYSHIRQGKSDVATERQLKEISRRLEGKHDPKPAFIYDAPFPFVYTPQPMEPAQVVELPMEPAQVVELNSNITNDSIKSSPCPSRKGNKGARKKPKATQMGNVFRPVLECVENIDACKPYSLSEQKDVPVSNINVENSENVEETIRYIAEKNINILKQSKRSQSNLGKQANECVICSKIFTANASLVQHYMSHLGMKAFSCNICDKHFTRRHSMKYHMMIHENTIRFKCPTCGHGFRHTYHFQKHLKKHTGEEPYSCDLCSKKFTTRTSLKRHKGSLHPEILPSDVTVSIHNNN